MKKLKEEYQPGGSKRQEILDKAVQYILNPKFGTQNAKHAFLLEEVGLSESEYLTCLNNANTNYGEWKWVDVQEHQWPGYTWAIGDGFRNRDQATSIKRQAASVKQQAWPGTCIVLYIG